MSNLLLVIIVLVVVSMLSKELDDCHTYIDQSGADREEKIKKWETAHYDTIGWLFQVGALDVRSPE